MSKKVKLFTIDKCYKPKELYRYNIEFEDGSSHGSCFCQEAFEEAYESCAWALCLELGDDYNE